MFKPSVIHPMLKRANKTILVMGRVTLRAFSLLPLVLTSRELRFPSRVTNNNCDSEGALFSAH